MKKNLLILFLAFTTFYSCDKDDSETFNLDKSNGILVNSDFRLTNKGYYISNVFTERDDDFIIVLTDGELMSLPNSINEIEFNNNTTTVIVFNCIQDPNTGTAWNFAPSGNYEFNSNNESFSYAYFKFNCDSENGLLDNCQHIIKIDGSTEPKFAFIKIEQADNSSIENYSINYQVNLSSSIIKGKFDGVLERL